VAPEDPSDAPAQVGHREVAGGRREQVSALTGDAPVTPHLAARLAQTGPAAAVKDGEWEWASAQTGDTRVARGSLPRLRLGTRPT